MLSGFQQYLVDKGFQRTYKNIKGEIVEDYNSEFLSSYNPLYYEFRKENHHAYWGLDEYKKPPVMNLGNDKIFQIFSKNKFKSIQDGYLTLFRLLDSSWYDMIYHVFTSPNLIFFINNTDEKNIKIGWLEIEKNRIVRHIEIGYK